MSFIFSIIFICGSFLIYNRSVLNAWEVKVAHQTKRSSDEPSKYRDIVIHEFEFFKGNSKLNQSEFSVSTSPPDTHNKMWPKQCIDGNLNTVCGTYPDASPTYVSVIGPDNISFDKIKIYNRGWINMNNDCCSYRIVGATVTYSVNNDVKFRTVLTTMKSIYELQLQGSIF